MDAPPQVRPEDVDKLMRLIRKGKRRVRYEYPLTREGVSARVATCFSRLIIPVTLFSRSLTFKTEAYVDSGAFCSIFQSEILEVLQLTKEQAQTKGHSRPLMGVLYPRTSSDFLFRLPISRLRASIAFSDKLKIRL